MTANRTVPGLGSRDDRAPVGVGLTSRAALLVAVVGALLAGLGVLTAQAQSTTRSSLLLAGQDKLLTVDTLAADAVGSSLSGLNDLVETHARRDIAPSALAARDPSGLRDLLDSLRAASPSIFSASVYDASGTLLALAPEVPGVIGKNFAFRDWYQGVTQSGQPYLSEPIQLITAEKPWAVASAALIRSDDGSTAGILVATFDLTPLQEQVRGFASRHDVFLTVTDRRGRVLASPRRDVTIGQANNDPRLLPRSVTAGEAQTSGELTADGARTQWAATAVPRIGGSVLAEQPVSSVLAGYTSQSRRTLVVLGAVLALAVVLLALLLRLDTRRRRLLSDLHAREAFLRSLVTHVGAGVTATDTSGVVTYTNTTDHETALVTCSDSALSAVRRPADLHRQALAAGRTVAPVEFVLDGPVPRRLQGRAGPILDQHGTLLGTVTVTHEVTELHDQRDRLRRAHAWAEALVRTVPSAIVVADAEGLVIQANTAAGDLTGLPEGALLGQPLSRWLHDQQARDAQQAGGAQVADGRLRRSDGGLRHVEVRTESFADPDGRPLHLVALVDVTAHSEQVELLTRQSRTDPLTGLANRFAVLDVLDQLPGLPLGDEVTALLFLALDGFKAVNDRLGHAAGDRLLADVAAHLTAAAREDDLVARIGGDEFVVVTRLHDRSDGAAFAERLRRAATAGAARVSALARLGVGASIGVAYPGPDGWVPVELLALADQRMYADKHSHVPAAAGAPLPSQRVGAPVSDSGLGRPGSS